MSRSTCPDNISTTQTAGSSPLLDPVARHTRADATRTDPPAIPARQPGVTRVDQSGSTAIVSIEPAALCAVFGVSDPDLASSLLAQLIGILHDVTKPVDAGTINHALASVQGFGPTDAAEAMTVVMLVAAEHAAMDTLRRAAHPAQSAAGRQIYTTLSLKAMRAFSRLLEVLNHGRGKSSTQRVIVERVTIEPGGQAVVGVVNTDRGRG